MLLSIERSTVIVRYALMDTRKYDKLYQAANELNREIEFEKEVFVKKKLIIATAVILAVLIVLVAFLRANRKDDEICFVAIITQIDSGNSIAHAEYAQRKPAGTLWDKLSEKKLPSTISFDYSHLNLELNELDVITGYYLCGSVDGQNIEVTRIISALPGDVKFYDDERAMVRAIALGNVDEAWNYVYQKQTDPNLKDDIESYATLFDNHEVKSFSQYKCERVGDFESEDGVYTETTYYKVYVLVDDFSAEPDYYAIVTARKDPNGSGIIALEISKERKTGVVYLEQSEG